ncbi:MAG: type II secretion system protein GspG [Deltaproteobacteria bacterium]|nr:type II secretion system protein GspG [Deltaproteobacteria bacterium]
MARRRREQTVFFPWERRGKLLRFPWMRSKALFAGLAMALLLVLFGMRERSNIGIRSTRATILVVREGIDAYRADHDTRCPASLALLNQEGYLAVDPVDAWGRPLQLTCPGRRNPKGYDLLSFGPSGDMRGIGRVE